MKRRAFSAGVGGAIVFASSFARAQKAMPAIGFLHSGPTAQNARRLQGFLKGLGDAGFVDQQTVLIDYRWADGQAERLPEMAADLVKRQVAVIATLSSQPAAGCRRGRARWRFGGAPGLLLQRAEEVDTRCLVLGEQGTDLGSAVDGDPGR